MTRGYVYPPTKEELRRDEDFMKMRDQIFKKIQPHVGRKEWLRFRKYMDSYYKLDKAGKGVIG